MEGRMAEGRPIGWGTLRDSVITRQLESSIPKYSIMLRLIGNGTGLTVDLAACLFNYRYPLFAKQTIGRVI